MDNRLLIVLSLSLACALTHSAAAGITRTFSDGGTQNDVSYCLANAPGNSADLSSFENDSSVKQYNPPYMRIVPSLEGASGCDGVVVMTIHGGLFESTYEADILSARTGRLISHIKAQTEPYFLSDLFVMGEGIFGRAWSELKTEKRAAAPPPAAPAPTESAATQEAQKSAAEAAQNALAMEAAVRAKLPAWRAQKVKPAMPKEARRYGALAEDAVREERFEDAVRYYEQALAIYPFWAGGHFNAAMIYGKQRHFGPAAAHMSLYVELAPKAEDVELAQDKIIVWEEKAKTEP